MHVHRAVTVLTRTASSLHSSEGRSESGAWSVVAVAYFASGLSAVLSDGDVLWIGVSVSRREGGRAGERVGERETEREREERRKEVRYREWSKRGETTKESGATNYTWQQESFLDRDEQPQQQQCLDDDPPLTR